MLANRVQSGIVYDRQHQGPPGGARKIMEEAPAVDAVPVIRCRDCKYGKLCFDANGQGLIQCTNPYYPASFAETWPFDLDWYCAGGERRDGNGTDAAILGCLHVCLRVAHHQGILLPHASLLQYLLHNLRAGF